MVNGVDDSASSSKVVWKQSLQIKKYMRAPRIERKQGESHAIRYLPMFPLSFGLKERLIMGVLKIICVARVASSGVNMSIADTVIYSILP